MSNDTKSEQIYVKAVDNKSRNFEMSGDIDYDLCNIFCDFDITKLDSKEYIRGITATSTSNLSGINNYLHINPLVDTEPPQRGQQALGINSGKTTDREIDVYLKYRFKGNGGLKEKYKLIDIFFKIPSKSVLAGVRYPMEVCLVFSTEDEKRYLVTCTPIKISPVNETDDILQKDLFTLLMTIANHFPTKGKTYSIENAPNWTPQIFFPVKTRDNASFLTWIDNNIVYIQFINPISVPYKFYETFADTLSGGIKIADQATKEPPQKENANFKIRYNRNEPAVDISTTYQCKEVTNKKLQSMINYYKKTGEKDTKEKSKPATTSCGTPTECIKSAKDNILLYIGLGSLGLFVILVLAGIWYYKDKLPYSTKPPSPPSPPELELKNLIS